MITPRPYQKEAVPKVREALTKTGVALVVIASGLGKTILSALTWHGFKKGRGLFLVHINGILDHAMGEYRKVYGDQVKPALYNGLHKNITGADIVFANLNTMRRHMHKFPRDHFSWMTVDETHHAQARTYRPVIDYFRCPKVGITATPDRKDLLDIRAIFGKEVVGIPLEEAIARNLLPKIEYRIVTDSSFDQQALQQMTKDAFEKGRRFFMPEINRRLFIHARDEKVAETIERREEKTIIFCSSIAHAEYFRKFLASAGVYHSRQHPKRNEEILGDFRKGVFNRLVVVDAFNEGLDVPDVGLVVFYRTTESEIVFRQQLGRGLRPTKEKLIVLDFVGNAERVQMLKTMMDKIQLADGSGGGGAKSDHIHVSGEGFDFSFSEAIVDVLKLIERVKTPLYATWQEASKAAIALGITLESEYKTQHWRDPKLPGDPRSAYKDFPGWPIFLGRQPKNPYSTWREASEAARKLKVKTAKEYTLRYKDDPRLYAAPDSRYPDFPGWYVFLGKRVPGSGSTFYPTWEEASKAALRLGIQSSSEYVRRRKEDPRFYVSPRAAYPKFPGWHVFLGKPVPNPYPTWQEAGKAAQKIGIQTQKQYREIRRRDRRLYAEPHLSYPDFPGWAVFLGKEREEKQ